MFWCLIRLSTEALSRGLYANPLEMAIQSAVACSEAKDGGLLVSWQLMECVLVWVVSSSLLLPSQIDLWGHHYSSSAFPARSLGSPFFFFCLPSYISGIHQSSSSAFPARSLGFTILLLLPSLLDLWGSVFYCFFCLPS